MYRWMLAFLIWTNVAYAEDLTVSAPDSLRDTGVLDYILPRFALKTGLRVTFGDGAAFGADGAPVFKRGNTVWHLVETPATEPLIAWLTSDIGKRTVEAFQPKDGAAFSADVAVQAVAQTAQVTGDAARGEVVSLDKCGRCHVVSEANKMNAIGSSPSFALMRTFTDWQERFETFFMLRPHPAFTQVEGVTEPFADHLPSPISPIEVTLEDIEAITAYVSVIAPADLGAPVRSAD